MMYSDSPKPEYKNPTGICGKCVKPYWDEHDHKPIRTLTPEEAALQWRQRCR